MHNFNRLSKYGDNVKDTGVKSFPLLLSLSYLWIKTYCDVNKPNTLTLELT